MKLYDYILYATVIVGWSTSWLPLKWQLGVVAPEVSLLWRFCLATVLMFMVTAAMKKPIWVPLHQHIRFAGLGLLLFSCNFTLFYYGGLNSTSGLLAVVFSTASLINIFLLAIIFGQKPKPIMIISAILGFVGVGMMFFVELSGGTSTIGALLLCLSGTTVFCFGNLLSSRIQADKIHVMTANCWGMMYGAIILFIISIIRGSEFMVEWTPKYIGGALWLASISSIVAFTAYLSLLGRIGAGRAGYVTVIFPVVALMISTVFEGYQWGMMAVIGLILVILGNLIMVRIR